jgi:hypothetical protein
MATKKKTSKTAAAKKTPAKATKTNGGKPPAGTISKSDFIRSNPDLSAKDLVVKAKETGLSIAPILVYKVRGRAKAKGPKAAKGTTAAAKGKPGPKAKDGQMSASAFVRSMPVTMKAKDVSEAAKAKGLKVSSGLVYMVRSADKKKAGGGAAPAVKAKGKPGPKPKIQYQTPKFVAFPGTGGGGGDETAFKKMALEIGFPRALQVIEELAKRAEAVQRQYMALLG